MKNKIYTLCWDANNVLFEFMSMKIPESYNSFGNVIVNIEIPIWRKYPNERL